MKTRSKLSEAKNCLSTKNVIFCLLDSVEIVNCKYLIIHSPQGLFRDNLQHWLEDFARLLKVQFTSTEGMSDDAPIHECENESSLTSHRFITCARVCETGPTVYRPYPRRLESLTICRCYYKGSTFSSVI